MAETTTDAVRHRLQIHFDPHQCEPTEQELAGMADDTDSLARQVGNFPVADLRVVIEWKERTQEYALKLSLILPGETLVTSDHDQVMHAAFERAKQAVADDLAHCSEDAKSLAMLAMIHAQLGEKNDALRAAVRARELLPISSDSFDGPILGTTLAAISAKLGDKDSAIQQLQSLIGVPNGPTPGILRVEPEWDSLRDDPRFKKLASEEG